MTAPDISPAEVSSERLKSVIGKIERLEEQKAGVAEDIRNVYASAKGDGFDTAIIRKIVALRKKSVEARREEEQLLDLYRCALGMEV